MTAGTTPVRLSEVAVPKVAGLMITAHVAATEVMTVCWRIRRAVLMVWVLVVTMVAVVMTAQGMP